MKKRILCLLLTLALVLPMLVLQMPQVSADTGNTKAISVVFDNSGSMYMGDNSKAWCRATYAMEIFASMLNEGDVMEIHPMNPAYLNTEGTGEKYVFGSNPLVINGPQDAQKIRDLFLITPEGGAFTPIESISAAHKSLQKMQGDDKYLVVLTDGATFYKNEFLEMDEQETLQELEKLLGSIRDVRVMYLGMGPANEPGGEDSTHYYATAKDTNNVLSELTVMSNMIFGRDALENVSGKMDIDVSMKKVIVFAQGKGASDVTLGAAERISQVKVEPSQRGIDPRPAVTPGNSYSRIPYGGEPDNGLGGVLATFGKVKANGDYPINVGGSYDNIEIYYEPDVSLKLQFVDKDTQQPVDPKECYAGSYTLSWFMVDNQTGEKTESQLLGQTQYDINLSLVDKDGNKKDIPATAGKTSVDLEMAAGDKLTGTFKVTYLGRYTSEFPMEKLGWGDGLTITPRQVGELTLQINPSSSQTYPLSQFAELAKYEVQLYCQGELVSGDALDRAQLQVSLEGGNAKAAEPQKGENGWTVTLGYNGQATDTQCGDYTLTFQAQYTNEDGESATTTGAAAFLLEDDSHGMKVKLQLEEDYYVLSSLEDAPPIYANLTTDGAPMEPDQFDKVTVSVTIEGLTKGTHYSWTPEKENARYVLRFLPGSDIDTTDYTIQVKATGLNEIGKEITASDSAEVSFNSYPLWVKILFWSLLFLILLTIWILWRNSKRLPKNVKMVPGMRFVVDGETVPGDTSPKKSGFGGKRGSMTVSAPDYMLMPMASSSCGFTLTLEAKSPRKTKSASRSAWVVGVRVADPMATESLTIGTESFIIDKETLKVYSAMNGPDEPIRFDIGGTTNFVVTSEIPSSNGRGTVSCTLTGEFEFC